jgi:hypothetical protein
MFALPDGLTFGLFLLLSLGYLIGAAFNILLRAGYAYRSKVNCYPTRLSFLIENWDTIVIRVFMYGYGAFYLWTLHPNWVEKIALSFGAPAWMAGWLTVPVGIGSSVGFGFLIDVLLDTVQSVVASRPYLSFLNIFVRGRVPAYNSGVVDTQKLAIIAANGKVVSDK